MQGVSLGPLVLAADRAAVLAGLAVLLILTGILGRRRPALASWGTSAALVAALAARAGHVAGNWAVYAKAPLTIPAFWQGGFAPWAGVAGFALVSALYLRRDRGLALPGALSLGAALGTGMLIQLLIETGATSLPRDVALRDLNGRAVAAESWAQGPMVLNLWASWCPPCRREMPMMVDEAARAGDVRYVFANQGEGDAVIRDFLSREGLVMAPLMDPGSALMRHFGAPGLPATLFIDARGQLIHARLGEISRAELRARTDALKGLE